MKILILGGNGLLGQTLFFYLNKNTDYNIYATVRDKKYINKFVSAKFQKKYLSNIDLSNSIKIEDVISKTNPDIIINCAAVLIANNYYETQLAIKINTQLPHLLCRLSSKYKYKLIHISTDGVFDGSQGNYSEDDKVIINDKYGMTKYLGEVVDNNAITIRTSIIGHHYYQNKGLVNWFLNANKSVSGYARYIYSGLPTVELSRIIVKFILPNNDINGLFHIASKPISKFELLQLISEVYNKKIKIVSLKDPQVNRTLNSTKFIKFTEYTQLSWIEMILEMKKDYNENIKFFK